MPIWVLAAERAYVAAAVGRAPGPPDLRQDAARAAASGPPDLQAHAIAAAGAVASRYLAVSTPRSFGIVIDAIPDVEAAGLALAAHLTWFAPSDIRCAATGTGAAELATATSGRVVAIDEALACDIVHIHSTRVRVTPAQLRREAGLPAVAAGLVDGRQLDEITIFCIDGAPIAMAATSILWRGFQ
jgi:hypothetical protein